MFQTIQFHPGPARSHATNIINSEECLQNYMNQNYNHLQNSTHFRWSLLQCLISNRKQSKSIKATLHLAFVIVLETLIIRESIQNIFLWDSAMENMRKNWINIVHLYILFKNYCKTLVMLKCQFFQQLILGLLLQLISSLWAFKLTKITWAESNQ